MNKSSSLHIWSDKIEFENDMAYFVDGETNILYTIDLKTNICEYVEALPILENDSFRITPSCMKLENDVIICFPDRGNEILIYDLVKRNLEKIIIPNPDNVRIGICHFWQWEDTIFAVSNGLKKVVEINIKERKINQYYTLSESRQEVIGQSIKVEGKIYCISSIFNGIYEFNIETKEIKFNKMPAVEDRLNTICYDGEKFWLSGHRKALYVWDKELSHLDTIESFPSDFGVYNFSDLSREILDCEAETFKLPMFIKVINMEENIWFIPFQTNKVLYFDKKSDKICAFEIDAEDESIESMKRDMSAKYIVEYIFDERYIGLYSLKNKRRFEIDTRRLRIIPKDYSISENSIKIMFQTMSQKREYIIERHPDDLTLLIKYCIQETGGSKIRENTYGAEIYDRMNLER